MAFQYGVAKRVGCVQGNGRHAEELQALDQLLGTLDMLQRQVHRFAQWRQHGLLEAVAVAQAGARQALQQQVELADQLAIEATAIVSNLLQAVIDLLGQLAVLGLVEAFGVALQ